MSEQPMVISLATRRLRAFRARKKKPGPASREGVGCAGPGVDNKVYAATLSFAVCSTGRRIR